MILFLSNEKDKLYLLSNHIEENKIYSKNNLFTLMSNIISHYNIY